MLHVKTMLGLGDALAARPTVAALVRKHGEVALRTPYPEVFTDIQGLSFVRPRNLNIRCAKRNAEESNLFRDDNSDFVRDVVGGLPKIQLSYSLHKGCKSIPEQIADSAGVLDVVDWKDFDMTDHAHCDAGHSHPRSPLGCFRIPTIRTEYKNSARNPAPGLVAAAVDEIGGDWIHLNDIGDGELPLHEDMIAQSFDCSPRAEASHGELSLPSMLDLVSRARCVVTPISWMAWAALAYQATHLIIWGGYAGPETILGPLGNGANICLSDPGCKCFNPSHDCAKSIPVERVREAARCLK